MKRVGTAIWAEDQEIREASQHGIVGTAVSLFSMVWDFGSQFIPLLVLAADGWYG